MLKFRLLNALEILTNITIPFKTSFESIPTARISWHSLSNFSGVSLLRILHKKLKLVIKIYENLKSGNTYKSNTIIIDYRGVTAAKINKTSILEYLL